MRVWYGILIVLLCAMLPASARAQGKSYALLVGVNEYFFGQGFPTLKYCAKDAHAIHETLIDECKYPKDNVKLLVSRGADPPTKSAIIDALQDIMKQATDEDTVLVYFSGHGLEVDKAGQVAEAATPANEREGLLATADCDIRKPGKTGLLVSELKRILAGENGRKSPKCKFLILDCCHAAAGGTKSTAAAHTFTQQLGSQLQDKEDIADFEKAIQSARGTITLASCMSHQKSLEDDINGQGLFTYYLVQGLSGKANRDRNAVVDHLELYSYLAQKVPEGAKLLSGDRSQSPVLYLGTDTTGLFALARLDPSKVTTGSSEATPARPRPSVEAVAAARRLKDEDFSNWQNDVASVLGEVDKNLTLANPQLLQSPYHDETTSRRVATFMTLALAAHRQQPPVPARIPASLAVAEFYSHDDSTKFKAEQFDSLAQQAGLKISLDPFAFDLPADPAVQSLRGHLLHAFAASRSADDAKSRRAAILAYAELTRLLSQREAEANSPLVPLQQDELYQRVLPLIASEEKSAASDAPLQRAMGALHGRYVVSMDQRQNLEKLAMLRQLATAAVQSNPEEPAYQLALIAFQLNMDQSDAKNPAADEPTLDRLAKSLDALLPKLNAQEQAIDRAIALRLRGDIHAYKSRLVDCQGPIDRSIKSALDTYTTAIQAFQALPAESRNSSYRRLRSHFADCFLGRSSMHIDWANKVVAKKATADRRTALQQALKDAREFEKLAPARGVIARRNVGNAYEDVAYLAGEMSSYQDAISVFQETLMDPNGIGQFDPQAWIDLGRAQYKSAYQVRYGDAVRPSGNKPKGLADAVLNLTEGLNLSQGKNHEARSLLGQVAFRTGELSVALNHFKDSLVENSGSGFDQKKIARDYADLQWVRVEAQVNKALRGEEIATEPDFALAEKSAKELPAFDPARDRILGEINLLKAKYLMSRYQRKETKADIDPELKAVGVCLQEAAQHLRSCLGLGDAAPTGVDECAEGRSSSLVFGAAAALLDCQLFALEQASKSLPTGLPFEGRVGTKQDVLDLCRQVDQAAIKLLATDPRLRDLRGRFGVLVVQFAKIKRDSSLFADAESWLVQSLPQQLPPAEEYQGQWRCAYAAAFAKSIQWMKQGQKNPNLKREALAHAEFALKNCADDREKTTIQAFIDDLKRR